MEDNPEIAETQKQEFASAPSEITGSTLWVKAVSQSARNLSSQNTSIPLNLFLLCITIS